MPHQIIPSNVIFYHDSSAPNEITDNNLRSRHSQSVITSEGGHTKDAQFTTSEGAHTHEKSLSSQLVPRRLLWHGHCAHGHRPRESPLVPAEPSHRSCSPRHRKGNGIHGTHERPPSTTTLERRFWKQMWATFLRISGHSRNRHMLLYQTHKHPERQEDHLRQKKM
jgi:hypothetical protein